MGHVEGSGQLISTEHLSHPVIIKCAACLNGERFLTKVFIIFFLHFHQSIFTLCVSPLGFAVLSTTLPTAEERASCDNKEFGCCPDGRTAASNPEGSNCPCKSKHALKILSPTWAMQYDAVCTVYYLHFKRINIFLQNSFCNYYLFLSDFTANYAILMNQYIISTLIY